MAEADETLALPAGTLRVVYSDDERPVEASVLIKGAHLYELLYHQTVETESGEEGHDVSGEGGHGRLRLRAWGAERMRHAGGGRRCLEGALRDTGYVSKVPLGALNDPKVPFGTSAMPRRRPSGRWARLTGCRGGGHTFPVCLAHSLTSGNVLVRDLVLTTGHLGQRGQCRTPETFANLGVTRAT